jgi:hypothetical protein
MKISPRLDVIPDELFQESDLPRIMAVHKK